MLDEPMPRGGVNELLRSKDGRDYLTRLQKRHWKDILQPHDPLFKKVYGDKLKVTAEKMEKNKKRAADEWEEVREKKQYEERKR